MTNEISMHNKIILKRKIIYFKSVILYGYQKDYYTFFFKIFDYEIKRNIYSFNELANNIEDMDSKTEYINIFKMVEDALGQVDTKQLKHSNSIYLYNNKQICTICKKIIYEVNNIIDAKKRIELHQPIIIDRINFNDEMIKSLYLTKPDDTCIVIKNPNDLQLPLIPTEDIFGYDWSAYDNFKTYEE